MIQLLVLLIYSVWIIAFVGIGSFCNTLIGKYFLKAEVKIEERILYFGTLGLLAASVVGSVLNFFFPLNYFISLVILFFGLAVFYLNRKIIIHQFTRFDYLIIGSLLFYCGLFSLMKLSNYDTGLYHLSAINWITSSPLPLGLANLHDRLGFNSSWLINASITQTKSLLGAHFFVINAIVAFFYGSLIFLALKKIVVKRKFKASSLFAIFSFVPWFFCLNASYSSPSPDVPAMLLTLLITYWLIRFFESKEDSYLILSLFLSLYAFTIKLSALPYLAGTSLILCFYLLAKSKKQRIDSGTCNKVSFLGKALIILLVVAVPFFARGVISSGYIAFPSTFGGAQFKWSVPADSAKDTAKWIRCWPKRQPGEHCFKALESYGWFYSWANDKVKTNGMLVYTFFGSLVLVLLAFILRRIDNLLLFIVVLCLPLGGIMFWFFLAPEPRFGYGYLYSFIGIMVSSGFYGLFKEKKIIHLLFNGLLFLLFVSLFLQKNINLEEARRVTKIQRVNYIKKITSSGDVFFAPEKGDQCFDGPLLCTPYNKKDIKIFYNKNDIPRMFIAR